MRSLTLRVGKGSSDVLCVSEELTALAKLAEHAQGEGCRNQERLDAAGG